MRTKQAISQFTIKTGEHLVALDRFIQATRDSGYRGTASAVAELVDNSLQAGARKIYVNVAEEGTRPDSLIVTVLDDGCGMSPETLSQALRFGGSTRFNDRSGLGRYGMGLPNSSFSQARRVCVTTWQSSQNIWSTVLDLDEIAKGTVVYVPAPTKADMPSDVPARGFSTGTRVQWTRCDRLDFRRASTITAKLQAVLGRTFRHFIWEGVQIKVNGVSVPGYDPLFLNEKSPVKGASLYGEPLEYDVDVQLPDGRGRANGKVVIRFSELPVHKWHKLTNEEKQQIGISKGAGVSIVRSGREIDFGWFLLGEKRKENYDDWWRCEIQFDPGLDEVFGITHTKQQVHPTHGLSQILTPDLETMAKTLNRRVRQAHERLQASVMVAESQRTASNRDSRLPPLPKKQPTQELHNFKTFIRKHPELAQSANGKNGNIHYTMIVTSQNSTRLFRTYRDAGQVVMALNSDHPFYKKIYAPLLQDDDPRRKPLRQQIELLLFAAARAEASLGKTAEKFLTNWSDVVATFLQ